VKKCFALILFCILLNSCRTISIKDKINFNEKVDWYLAGGSPEKTNISYTEKELTPPFKLLWTYNTEAAYSKYSISVCDRIIFTSNLKGDVFALDIYSGGRLGSFGTNGKTSYSTPVIYEKNIIVTCSNSEKNTITSYNFVSGNINWERNIGDVYSSPIIIDSSIYVSTSKGYIYKLKAKTGFTEWIFNNINIKNIPEPFFAGPTLAGNLIIAGNTDGYLYALNSGNGKKEWDFKTNSNIYCDAAFYKGKIFSGSDDGFFYCLDTVGSLLWKKEIKSAFQSSPTFYNDMVIIPGIDGYIYSLDINSGNNKWVYETKGTIWASPLVNKNKIFIGSFDNYFYCLDADNGKLLWKYLLDGRIRTSAVIWEDFIVVGCDDKLIYCFK
jgi:eukaryotic-like serine/threonine-protein kinase